MLRGFVRTQKPVLGLLDSIVPGNGAEKPPTLPTVEPSPHAPSAAADVEAALAKVESAREAWMHLSSDDKTELLKDCMAALLADVDAFAADAAAHKGTHGNGLGEEMLLIYPVLYLLSDLQVALAAHGQPQCVRQRKVGGRTICDVGPKGLDNMLFGGARAEVWIREGEEPTQGKIYRDGTVATEKPGVCAILAAGNHFAVAVRDVMHQLFVEHRLCIVKMNPVNDWTGRWLLRICAPLVRDGYLQVVYGGTDIAQKIVKDARVTAVHMTGSEATYNRIMWGAASPSAGKRLLDKPFTAELGCITPFIVVPSATPWTQAELDYHAMHACQGALMNAGHNCNATEVIVTAKGWPQRDAFVQAVRNFLDACPQRWVWYPGSKDKMAEFKKRFPQATEHGSGGMCTASACTSPALFAAGLAASEVQGQDETWSPCLQEVALECGMDGEQVDVDDFLNAAVAFCNDSLYGTLSASLALHPSTQAKHADAVNDAVARLRYGLVAVNISAFVSYGFTVLPWGAWNAAGTPEAIGTGNVLQTASMYDNAEKGVLWLPFTLQPKALWHPLNTNMEASMRALFAYVADRGPVSLVRLIAQALRSK